MNFVDRVRIQVRGGDGGAGVASFHRQKGKPRGKPNGGSGGRGGHVVLVASADVASLLTYSRKPHWRAGDGTHGQGDLKHGAKGDDLILPVPLGTTVLTDDGTVLADLVEPGQKLIAARGGRGGRGNAAFVSAERKAPSFAEQGEYGDEAWVDVELKLIADAALVGYPNAGKSTLISRVSAARPKIADYPFTTLTPNLGVVSLGDREFVLADVPGLIEGAAAGKGLGHEFLRHVERARVLVIMLDPTSLQDVSPEVQHEVLVKEMSEHAADLGDRARLVVLNKTDTEPDTDRFDAWAIGSDLAVHKISAVTGEGLEALMHAVADEVQRHERQAPDRQGYVLHRPLAEPFTVAKENSEWVVRGRAAERAVNLDDLTVPEAADFAARRLAGLGVDTALLQAGAQPGDDVRIGDIVFTFDPDLLEEVDE
jgi:GTP-binding protein